MNLQDIFRSDADASRHLVERIDYAKVVSRLSDAQDDMPKVLHETLMAVMPEPKTRNEVRYFMRALFNAARDRDELVWLKLCNTSFIRHYAPPEVLHGSVARSELVAHMELPIIGGPDDEPWIQAEIKRWPAEPTEDNFQAQAAELDRRIRTEAQSDPNRRCQSISDFVASFADSGTGKINSRIMMAELGLNALATEEGTAFLVEQFGPAKVA